MHVTRPEMSCVSDEALEAPIRAMPANRVNRWLARLWMRA